jgi:ABC-type branched-subunit amino acid transport system substrate-binding protein
MNLDSKKRIGIGRTVLAIIIVVILVVAAAGVILLYPSASPSTTSTTSTTPTTSTTHTTTTTGGAGSPIIMGVAEDTNGEVGPGIIKAIQLAANQVNAKGGILLNGKYSQLQVVSEDTYEEQTNFVPSDVTTAVTKLITVDHANVILGGYGGSGYIPPLSQQYKTLYISGSGGSINSSQTGLNNQYQYTFQDQIDVNGWGTYESYALLYYALIYHAHQVAWVTEDQAFFHTHLQEAQTLLAQYGITINPIIFFPTTQTDFSSIVQQIRSSGDPVTFDGFIVDNSAPFMTQWKDTQMQTFLVGLDNPGGLPGVCNSTSGLYNYLLDLEGLQRVPITNITLSFFDAYNSFVGTDPNIYDANYYTGALMYASAVQKAQTLDTATLAQTIHDGQWQGVQGVITFNDNNFVPVPDITIDTSGSTPTIHVGPGFAMLFSQWQNCHLVIVFPTQFATTQIQYPPWWQPPT